MTALVQEVDIAPVHNVVGEALIGISRMSAEAERRSRERAVDVRRWAEERAEKLGISINVSLVRCRPEGFAEKIVPVARYHDLAAVVVDVNEPQRQAEVEDLIFGSGGPVLLLPALEAAAPVSEERATPLAVVVAWDGSISAARALRGAMPILRLATTVSLVTVGDDKDIDPAGIAGVETHLLRHGIRTKHLHRTRGASPVGDILQAVAVTERADILVMGAHGRNRLQEMVLGGATRTILHSPRLPVLLAH